MRKRERIPKTGKVAWTDDKNLFVVRKGKTSNKKIAPNGWGVTQTYTFSRAQYELVHSGNKFTMHDFFDLDHTNCMDCEFSRNSGNGKCYTHKIIQYSGMLSMLRSLSSLPGPLTVEKGYDIVEMSMHAYVRFGTYGEPSLMPIDLVKRMVDVASSWTGYTHQWDKDWAIPYKDYFMASVSDALGAHEAQVSKGYRSFIASTTGDESAVSCPASKESGFISNCAKCGLCSGLLGKGKKDIKILMH